MRNLLVLLSCCALAAAAAAAENPVIVTRNGDAPELEVRIQGEPFTTYRYSDENRKPFLWPVYAEGQVRVTRDWPMDPNAPGPTDHVHQKSMWTAYGDLNGVDCWAEGEKSGYQHSDEVTFGSGAEYGWIKARNTWQDSQHKPVIAEEREYRFYPGPASARVFDLKVTFTAAYGDVLFKDTKEGGLMAFRIRPELQENNGGVITNASGAKGARECWGKPSPWCDYSGALPGVGVRGIAVFDHPGNLRYPTCWHVRDYGLNGANCFGLAAFTDGKENGDYTLKAGESVTFRYRVVVHSGDAKQAKLAEKYEEFVKAPAF